MDTASEGVMMSPTESNERMMQLLKPTGKDAMRRSGLTRVEGTLVAASMSTLHSLPEMASRELSTCCSVLVMMVCRLCR